MTDLNTAEMIKYASNAFLATKISFINEFARICDQLGADVKGVIEGIGYDTRIGRAFLDAGLGFGGSCFSKDIRALKHIANRADLYPELLDVVMKINRNQRRVALEKLEMELGGTGSLRGKTIALLGLAFKPNTDDMRDAPAIDLANWLIEAGAQVRAFDPVAVETARREMPDYGITYCEDAYDAAHDSHGVILVTEWPHFNKLDLARLRGTMYPCQEGQVFIDGRNLFEPTEMMQLGFRYHGIGRGSARTRDNASRPEETKENSCVF
jgi:UDPglucose 6-dehydrogenase